jgi:hypothetical protein
VGHRKDAFKLIVLVSSSVYYGNSTLLDQIYAVLTRFGYEVWMSHKGTMPVNSTATAFDNCLTAVERCDAFLGIITGWYGSGVEPGQIGITHKELLEAINQDKLRWFLAHQDVTLARQLLKQFRFNPDGTPKPLDFKSTPVLSDIRVLDMYESAIRNDLPLARRTGNWVQPYSSDKEALQFVRTQFQPKRIRELLARP